jgi:MFS family permease
MLVNDNRAKGVLRFSRNYKAVALISITIARAVYALNWYTLSPGLSQVSHDFSVSTTNLGILEAAFLVGAGTFQIPSTIGAARWGAKSLCVGGMLVIAGSNIFGGFANSFALLILLRFMLGIGASMFFAPAIAVVGDLFQDQNQGLAIGIYNSAFSVGGSFALFGWAYIDSLYTWRGGLILGAVLAGALGIENYIVIRHSEKFRDEASKSIEAAKGVLKNKQVWLLGFGIVGVWAAYYVVGQFLPFFEETARHLDLSTSSFMTTQIFLWPIPASIIGGYTSDRFRNRRQFMLIPSVVFGIATALIGFANFSESWLIMITLGIADAFIFTALYASVYQMPELDKDQRIISIALMNTIQITGAFIGPLLFSYFASISYSDGWLAIGIFVLPFCVALTIAREPFKINRRKVTRLES